MKKTVRSARHSRRPNSARLGGLLVLVAGLGLLVVAAFTFWQNGQNTPTANFTPEAKGAPRLKANQQKVDLGDVKLGQTVQVSFEISNTGDQTLRFAKDPFVEVVEGC